MGSMQHILSTTDADMRSYEDKTAGRLKQVNEQMTLYGKYRIHPILACFITHRGPTLAG